VLKVCGIAVGDKRVVVGPVGEGRKDNNHRQQKINRLDESPAVSKKIRDKVGQ